MKLPMLNPVNSRAVGSFGQDHAIIWLTVFVAYTLINWHFSGPTYLTDEVG